MRVIPAPAAPLGLATRPGGREVQVSRRMSGEPSLHLRMGVRAIVVQDQMDLAPTTWRTRLCAPESRLGGGNKAAIGSKIGVSHSRSIESYARATVAVEQDQPAVAVGAFE